jgi:hypothetical protein
MKSKLPDDREFLFFVPLIIFVSLVPFVVAIVYGTSPLNPLPVM